MHQLKMMMTLVVVVVNKNNCDDKLIIEWQESELMGGSPLFMIDESNGVAIKCEPKDGLQLWIFARRKEGEKYYCRVIKKFTIPDNMLEQHNFNRYTHHNKTNKHIARMNDVKYINNILGYCQ